MSRFAAGSDCDVIRWIVMRAEMIGDSLPLRDSDYLQAAAAMFATLDPDMVEETRAELVRSAAMMDGARVKRRAVTAGIDAQHALAEAARVEVWRRWIEHHRNEADSWVPEPFEPDTSASLWALLEGSTVNVMERTPEAVLQTIADRTRNRMELGAEEMARTELDAEDLTSFADVAGVKTCRQGLLLIRGPQALIDALLGEDDGGPPPMPDPLSLD